MLDLTTCRVPSRANFIESNKDGCYIVRQYSIQGIIQSYEMDPINEGDETNAIFIKIKDCGTNLLEGPAFTSDGVAG